MRLLVWVAGVVTLTGCALAPMARAQGTKIQAGAAMADLLTPSDFAKLSAEQLAVAAKSPNGLAIMPLATYPGHHTMLVARVKDGAAEVHANYADFLVVIDGEGTELIGGTVVEPKEQGDGETRGLRLEGAASHILRKGDVIHIPVGVPHQALVAPGKTMTAFVIKVAKVAGETGDSAAK